MITTAYRGSKRYQIHVDDSIQCLYDINLNKDTYTSIFDNPFLAIYKDIHDQYGTVFTLGLFYKQSTTILWNVSFPAESVGWELSQMTDKFKAEWQANSDWLKFDFHSYEYAVYYNATSRDIGEDYDLVKTQVLRFAGADCWVEELAQLHGIYGSLEQINALKVRGHKYVMAHAYHVYIDLYGTMSSYYLSPVQHAKMFSKGTYYDTQNDMLFIAGAGNIARIIGFNIGGVNNDVGLQEAIGMYDYLDNYVGGKYYYNKQLDYLAFNSHEPEMANTVSLTFNSVIAGNSITVNGITYTAVESGATGRQFNIGVDDDATAANFYAKFTASFKFRIANNLIGMRGVTITNPSTTIKVIKAIDEHYEIARWCQDNGYEPGFFTEASLQPWITPTF